MLRIDGSQGEGGGQILRTSISLSVALGEPIEIYNIRANRSKPGLRPQHLSVLQTIAKLSNSETHGLSLNSTKVSIYPNKLHSKNLNIDIGTAGSITLLIQSLIQAISISDKKYNFLISGGTDVNWSPSADYFRRLVVPLLETLGFSISTSIIKRGFYPKGNGQINFEIYSPKKLDNLLLVKPQFDNIVIDGILTSEANIPSNESKSKIEYQCQLTKNFLENHDILVDSINPSICNSHSNGSVICISSISSKSFIGSDILATKDIPFDKLGILCSKKFLFEHNSKCTIDHHLADMIIPLLSISKEPSIFLTSFISNHLKTNLEVCKLITGMTYKISKKNQFCYSITINP